MTPLEEKIQQDLKEAMRAKRQAEVTALRSLLAQIKDERIKLRPKREMIEDDVLRVIMTAVKRRKEAIELYTQGQRNDLVEKEQAELAWLQRYLPEQLSEQELTQIIDRTISQVGAQSIKDMGKVMGAVMAQVKGKADGKVVQNLVKQRLNNLSA